MVEDEIGQEDEVEFPLLVVFAADFVQNLEQRIWRCSPREPLSAVQVRVSGRRLRRRGFGQKTDFCHSGGDLVRFERGDVQVNVLGDVVDQGRVGKVRDDHLEECINGGQQSLCKVSLLHRAQIFFGTHVACAFEGSHETR